MTGDLGIVKASFPTISLNDTTNSSYGSFQNNNHITELGAKSSNVSGADYRSMRIYDNLSVSDLKEAFKLVDRTDGAVRSYDILHTGNLANYVSGQSKVVEYTGTGKTSVSVAIGFVPKLIVVQEVLSVSSSGSPATLPLIFTGVGQALGLYRNSNSGDLAGFAIKVTAFGETVIWSGTDHVEANNNLNTTYRVTAIG